MNKDDTNYKPVVINKEKHWWIINNNFIFIIHIGYVIILFTYE